jgi:DNA-binding NarL/FixJ family response regulator
MDVPAVRVLVVDDNEWIGEAVERVVRRQPDLDWAGWLPTTSGLNAAVREREAAVVLIDLDIPGEDSFAALRLLSADCPGARAVILSGYLRSDLIDRGLEAGAWGYVSKNEDLSEVVAAIRQVARGEIALSTSVAAEFLRR